MIDGSPSEIDNESELPTVNRCAVTLVATEAYRDWAQSCFEDEGEMTLEEVRREPTV